MEVPRKREQAESKGAFQARDKLPAKDAAEHLDGQEERIARGHPPRTVGREPADRDHAVYMRVVQQILTPGVEHAQKADRGAEMLGVSGNLEECGGTRAEQQIVDDLLVLEGQPG